MGNNLMEEKIVARCRATNKKTPFPNQTGTNRRQHSVVQTIVDGCEKYIACNIRDIYVYFGASPRS